jgi:hypothetical protein
MATSTVCRAQSTAHSGLSASSAISARAADSRTKMCHLVHAVTLSALSHMVSNPAFKQILIREGCLRDLAARRPTRAARGGRAAHGEHGRGLVGDGRAADELAELLPELEGHDRLEALLSPWPSDTLVRTGSGDDRDGRAGACARRGPCRRRARPTGREVNWASSATWLVASLRIRSLASRTFNASSRSSTAPIASSGPRQNVFPITAAPSRAERAPVGIASMRAAIAALTVTGSSSESTLETDAASSSRKRGLPSATSTRRPTSAAPSPEARSRWVASSAASAAESGSRRIVVWATRPLPHVGCQSRSSGRARAMKTVDFSWTGLARYSSSSSSLGFAQWMCSKATSVGCASPSDSTKRRAARKSSPASSARPSPPSPSSSPR